MANVTAAEFRAAFPAFADPALYPNPELEFWIGLAYKLMDPFRWGDIIAYGAQLFVAHNLALSFNDLGGQGQAPGAVTGAVTSASVDKVSYSRDPGSAMDPQNGHWNLTTFGLRYIRLVRMIGAGPVQIGAPFGPAYPGEGQNGNGAWPGVIPPVFG